MPRPVFPETYLNANVGRSRSQTRAVALALGLAEGEALVIEGPPGTGKSTTTGEMVAQIMRRDPMARILVCSHSNHGTDNMLMKCVPYVDQVPGLELARVGMWERVPPDLRKFFIGPDEGLSEPPPVVMPLEMRRFVHHDLIEGVAGQLLDKVAGHKNQCGAETEDAWRRNVV